MPSQAHDFLKGKASKYLRDRGYIVFEEYRIKIEGKLHIVDVAGFRGKESIAIECGRTRFSKIDKLRESFTKVKRLLYTSKINPKLFINRENKQICRHITQKEALELRGLLGVSKAYQHGKTQVPKDVREVLNLKDGDRVLWYNEDGVVFVKRLE